MKAKTMGILILAYAICIIVGAIGLVYIAIHFIAKFW